MAQLFDTSAFSAVLKRQQSIRKLASRGRRATNSRLSPGELAALRVTFEELHDSNRLIYAFVVQKFAEARITRRAATVLGLLVARFLFALPLREVAQSPIRDRLNRNWSYFQNRELLEVWAKESLARAAPNMLPRLTEHLRQAEVGRRLGRNEIDFARTLVLAATRAVHEAYAGA